MSQTPEQNHTQEEDNIPLQHDAEHERPPRNKQQSVLIYLVILFAAAFLLMAMSYLMQRRSSDATIEDLRESVTAMQSVGDIQTQNETLRQQVADLEEQLEEAQRELEGLQTLTENLTVMQEQLTKAMDLFWQIDEAYVRGRWTLCRELIGRMEDVSAGSALKESLPRESTTDNDRFSPADRYQEIYDAVM